MPRGKKATPVSLAEAVAPETPVVAMPLTGQEAPKRRGRRRKSEIEARLEDKAAPQDAPEAYLGEICAVIGGNIRFNRKLRKFSIDNLSNYLELSSSYVGLLERGERCPSLKTLLKICELFGITLGELIASPQGGGRKAVVAEDKKSSVNNKQKSVVSLLHKLTESELDFVITVLKAMKSMQKKADGLEE